MSDDRPEHGDCPRCLGEGRVAYCDACDEYRPDGYGAHTCRRCGEPTLLETCEPCYGQGWVERPRGVAR